jgi:hypothetical protein
VRDSTGVAVHELRARLPAGAKFCFECATPVSAPGSSPRLVSPEAYIPKHLAEDRFGHKMLTFQWQEGKKVIVWLEELAPGKPRFPTPPWSHRP